MPGPRHILAFVLLVLLVAGCGGDVPPGQTDPRSRLVDPARGKPYVNALTVDEADGGILLSTNRGLYRLAPGEQRAQRVRGRFVGRGEELPVGDRLAFAAIGPGRLLGTGHPDGDRAQTRLLGVLASDDGGRQWRPIAGAGEIDLHAVRSVRGRLLGFDLGGALLASDDGGRTFTDSAPPPGGLDLAADPRDPARLVASTGSGVFRSQDSGRSWRPVLTTGDAALAWSPRGPVVRADPDGKVSSSTDGGATWRETGRLDGTPGALTAAADGTLVAALVDGTLLVSRDAGRTWKVRARP